MHTVITPKQLWVSESHKIAIYCKHFVLQNSTLFENAADENRETITRLSFAIRVIIARIED
jgi:hypothetical protein